MRAVRNSRGTSRSSRVGEQEPLVTRRWLPWIVCAGVYGRSSASDCWSRSVRSRCRLLVGLLIRIEVVREV